MGIQNSFRKFSVFFLVSFLIVVQAEAARPKSCGGVLANRKVKKIRIGSLNVENAFSPIISLGNTDKQFIPDEFRELPFGPKGNKNGNYDWTWDKLEIKAAQIGRMIEAMGVPDLMGLVEVEDHTVAQAILSALRKQGMNYDGYLITSSPDDRGLDVMLLYKNTPNFRPVLQYAERLTGEHFDQRASRDILEAGFVVNKRFLINVYTNHWPSQGAPDSQARYKAAQKTRRQPQTKNQNGGMESFG